MDWKNLVHTYIRAYTPLPSQADADENEENPGKRRCGYSHSSLLLSMILLISVSLNVWFVHKLSDLNLLCSRYTSLYDSPSTAEQAIRYKAMSFNGSFFTQTAYRGPAGPDTDAVWSSLGKDYAPISIPEDQASRYGLQQGQVKFSANQGGGFVANIEVFHHLHCLNLLRKGAWYNYSHYKDQGAGPFANSEDILKVHYTHCLDILRQQIMCTADTGVFGQWWVKDIGPFVDFNTKHKCKNFEDIRVWAEKKQVRDGEREVEFRMRIWYWTQFPNER